MIHDTVILPHRSLIVLCGPAGAGKSTFASAIVQRNGLANTAVVSSDACRLMLCDDIRSVTADQWSTLQPHTFQLFLTIVGMRLSLGRPAIADGVNL
ncbi:MAG: AAA family ATPase [Thermomicrobiales bacterium]